MSKTMTIEYFALGIGDRHVSKTRLCQSPGQTRWEAEHGHEQDGDD